MVRRVAHLSVQLDPDVVGAKGGASRLGSRPSHDELALNSRFDSYRLGRVGNLMVID